LYIPQLFAYFKNFGRSLATQCAQNETKLLSRGSIVDGFLSVFVHKLVVIILMRKYLAVGVISGSTNRIADFQEVSLRDSE
jgi:hypothetical protein